MRNSFSIKCHKLIFFLLLFFNILCYFCYGKSKNFEKLYEMFLFLRLICFVSFYPGFFYKSKRYMFVKIKIRKEKEYLQDIGRIQYFLCYISKLD